MPRLLIFLLALWARSAFAQSGEKTPPLLTQNTLDSMGVVKVVSYNYALKPERGRHISTILHEDGLDPTTVLPGHVLSKTELGDMMALFNDTSLYGASTAACFDPRWAFVFYGEGDKILAVIDICMACNSLTSDFDLPNDVYGEWYEYGDIDGETISYFVPQNGFTPEARMRLDAYCNSLVMSRCRGLPSVFDGQEYLDAYEEAEREERD